jgi:hypothetical protein
VVRVVRARRKGVVAVLDDVLLENLSDTPSPDAGFVVKARS